MTDSPLFLSYHHALLTLHAGVGFDSNPLLVTSTFIHPPSFPRTIISLINLVFPVIWFLFRDRWLVWKAFLKQKIYRAFVHISFDNYEQLWAKRVEMLNALLRPPSVCYLFCFRPFFYLICFIQTLHRTVHVSWLLAMSLFYCFYCSLEWS